ncbi:MAG TPA: PP2C family protein-serine/threonine phosphatase [Candidatus Bathyarchaeia archaeon]|nr:PP2C family protein-serine/threonine phosphatase [Candidatus Bathyarchaeia archaeon]
MTGASPPAPADRRTLRHLLDPGALEALIRAAAAVAPDLDIRLVDRDGAVLGSTSADPARQRVVATPSTTRTISVDAEQLGSIETRGPDDRSTAVADLIALAVELAATEALRNGSVASLASIAFEQELAIGRRIQLSLMPRRFPALVGWEIATAYEAAREVGGDFYDAFLVRGHPERLGVVIADVTGKGIAAAILMADARALIHAAADHTDDPAECLARVNRILVDERRSGLFVTVAHGLIDAPTGSLAFASAGHDPVHIVRSDGSLTTLEPSGRLIGMVAEIEATSTHLVIEPGDAFVGHTDGVTEARSADGSFYGEERFRALLSSLAGRPARAIVDAVTADVASFRGGAEPSDDLTLIVVRRVPLAPVEAPD